MNLKNTIENRTAKVAVIGLGYIGLLLNQNYRPESKKYDFEK